MDHDSQTVGPRGTALVVSGPSGVGKSTVCTKLRELEPGMHFSVSCTTRAPRPGERHGHHYYFLSTREFEDRLQAGAFLEHASVYGCYYGTLRTEVEPLVMSGRNVLLDIDVQGAQQVRAVTAGTPLGACVVCVFIGPPSFAVLERRLRERATEPEEVIQRRLTAAPLELAAWRTYDYVVINDDVSRAVADLRAILAGTRCSVPRLAAAPWE